MTSHETPNDSLLRLGVTANAVLSLVIGVVFLVAAPAIGNALDVEVDGWIRLIGIALIGHAAILAWVRQIDAPTPWTWLNLAIIAPYPLLMVLLTVAVIEPAGGKALVLLDSTLVGAVALVQFLGLRRSIRPVPFRRAAA